MKASGIRIEPRDDGAEALLRFDRSNGKVVTMTVDADDMEGLIRTLAKGRMMMRPVVGGDPTEGDLDSAELPTRLRFAPGRPGRRRALYLAHPGLGWLAFGLSDEQATQLAADLVRDLPASR